MKKQENNHDFVVGFLKISGQFHIPRTTTLGSAVLRRYHTGDFLDWT
jgi:hypothetical protein